MTSSSSARGSSGGVVAARLTENPDCRVLLLEAGPDFPSEEAMPPLFTVSGEHSWKTAAIPEFDWDFFNADRSGTLDGRQLWLPRGRLMGGTSMVNATIAARGAPFDFDRWAAMGNAGWAWDDVLPYFIKIETDLDFGDQPIHGNGGPIVIQRYKPESWAPVNRVMYEACVELGIREAPDLNALDAHAGVVGVMPHNRYKEVRLGHARHLHPRRAQAAQSDDPRRLRSSTGCMLSGGRAEGVAYIDCRRQERRPMPTRSWSAPASTTRPAILQRSGIGPSDWLKPLGIKVAADLPVGKQSPRSSRLRHDVQGQGARRHDRPHLRRRRARARRRRPASRPGRPIRSRSTRRKASPASGPTSRRQDAQGEVTIQSRDPRQAPLIDHRYNTVEQRPPEFRRRPRLLQGDAGDRDLPAARRRVGGRPRQADRRGARRQRWAPPITRRAPQRWGRQAIRPPSSAPISRVHGFDNLRVADTSIYPDNVMHNTNLTALVVGEKTAEIVAAALR